MRTAFWSMCTWKLSATVRAIFHINYSLLLAFFSYQIRPVASIKWLGGAERVVWLVPEKHKFSGTNQTPERRRPFGTGLVRHCPQGLFSPFFTFLRVIFFRPFRLSLVPFICPWVSEDATTPGSVSLKHGFTHDKSVPCLFSTCFDFFYGGSCEDIVRLSISCKRAKT